MAPSSASLPAEFSFRTRQEAWDRLKTTKEPLPIVIIGGGIVGAGLLRELALSGTIRPYLFEKADFASGTSSVSSKLIHAGIRYLEQVWVHLKAGRVGMALQSFTFVFGASRERRTLGKLAPALVKPKRIHLVLARTDSRSILSVAAGTWLYYVIQIFQRQFFPPPTFSFSLPELDKSKVKAVFSFWDSETDDARLVIENLKSANEHGATALNYVELLGYKKTGSGVSLSVRNNENGETVELTAKLLINATGAFVDDVRAKEQGGAPHKALIDRVAGSHLNVYPAISAKSLYVSASDNRLVFVLRRDEDGLVYSRIGTTERAMPASEASDQPLPTAGEVEYLEKLVKEYFPHAVLNEKTIIRMDAGIRPLRSQADLDPFNKSREHDIVKDGSVYHIVGVKLTDYRRVAREILRALPFEEKGIPTPQLKTEPLRRVANQRMYEEITPTEFVRNTMILHWQDYVLRRRGLHPLWTRETNPAEWENEFNEIAQALGWDAARQQKEKEGAGAWGKKSARPPL